MKKFLLRILPYLISIFIGLAIFFMVQKIEYDNENISNLLINISSDLLSIPFVFISYEVISRICNKDLKNALFKSTSFEINSIILNIVNDMRSFLGYKDIIQKENLEEFLILNKKVIVKRIKFNDLNKDLLEEMQKNKDTLSSLIKKSTTLEALDGDQIKNLLYLLKELDIVYNKFVMINEAQITIKIKNSISENFENIIKAIRNWLDSCETDALINHQNVKII